MALGNLVGLKMKLFIYDMICLNEYTDEDIETIKSYEGPQEFDKHQEIDEVIKACKLFKAKYVLLKKELPPIDEIAINVVRVAGQIAPKIVIETINPFDLQP